MRLVNIKVSPKQFCFIQMDEQEKKMEEQRRETVHLNIWLGSDPVVSQTWERWQREYFLIPVILSTLVIEFWPGKRAITNKDYISQHL